MIIPYSLNTLKSISQNFFKEILKAEAGKKSSLSFIKLINYKIAKKLKSFNYLSTIEVLFLIFLL